MNISSKDALFYIQQYLYHYPFLLPLGIIGIWRWSVWVLKEIIGLNYRPKTSLFKIPVSIVTPVYNEDPVVFQTALESWKKNDPAEIIAVIDYTDANCIEIFKRFSESFPQAILIITHTPGKRPALADGIRNAKSEIVALVDSDTIWGKDVIRYGLSPFKDNMVAGVGTYQSVLEAKTFAQKIFDVQLDLRYLVEYPFLAASGDALICLSGRTAFYRKQVILPMLWDLVNEKFLGKPVISGDDKTLTYLALEAGWKVAYQSNSHVYTPGMKDLRSYLKQRLRWSRNALRADLKAVFRGWPLKHPALLFFQIDKLFQSLVVILSPIYFFVALFTGLWQVALVIFVWWFISRTIKMYPHLSRNPRHFTLIPGYILYSFVTGFIKIYAFFTLNTQGWITRWDKSRLPQLRFLNKTPAYIATLATVFVLSLGVYYFKQITYFIPQEKEAQLLSSVILSSKELAMSGSGTVLGASIGKKDLLIKKYVLKIDESIFEIAKKLNIDHKQILYANITKIPNWHKIKSGTVLSIPGRDVYLEQKTNFNYQISKPSNLVMKYDKPSNTIYIGGRSNKVTLTDIVEKGFVDYIKEISPKVWYLRASIYISTGVTFLLDKKEVDWLKLESNKDRFVIVRSQNGEILINGVKITSWDEYHNDYDKNLEDGRSFILAKNIGRMDIYDSELAYLGFNRTPNMTVSPYGVSWKLNDINLKKALLTGEVLRSKFHHNYFGVYTFGATGMIWRNNESYNNIRYGFDPHDDSNGFIFENNKAYNNGAHGIIFSKRCRYNTIRNNISYNNHLHGIMLHERSDFNLIENNSVEGNTGGITLWHSSNNVVRNNRFINNRHGVRANMNSDNNLIEGNIISGSKLYGLYLYEEANRNIVQSNTFSENDVGMYIKSDFNTLRYNKLLANRVAVYFMDRAKQNELAANEIRDSKKYGVYSKVSRELYNLLGYNVFQRNREDITGQ